MTKVSIISVPSESGEAFYHAFAEGKQGLGASAGEALDSLTEQLQQDAAGTLVVVQNRLSDEHFCTDPQHRMEELLQLWRDARDRGESLPDAAQRELERLVDEELKGAALRTRELADQLEG